MTTRFWIGGNFFVIAFILSICHVMTIPPAEARGRRNLSDVSMFTDQKARQVGDVLTVLVIERASASKAANTQTSRASDRKGGLSGFVGINTRGLGDGISLTSGSTFDGAGTTSRTDTLDATVAAVVTEVLPNGNLRVEGQRHITVNSEKQILTVKGVVRPRDIAPNNTIRSINLAEAEIKYQGEGIVSRQQKPGLISRILDFIWIF
ncbi:MAG: flagellar basal body L-ring protein FlgH [Candidatus Poribacteria bacterium]|nr:flagellar basal body L-ring protein FlgH [Candidatus Poribacteria bacterium]